ncbi:MAG: phage minor head protein [Undibacterium umbellatum]|uniref:phage minor head protein n=1 Tax=Undibacterium umbellatum TaxID=2762300 RepID=UPI003BB5DCAD
MADLEQLPPWNKPFAQQLAFFKKKLNLPSERWDDITRQAHDKAFIVAGAQGADLLTDLHNALNTAIEKGTGIQAFRKEFKQIVQKNGWTGWTGEESAAKTAWRTKVIYQTNMTSSYAAGRWKQLNNPELLKALPYWQYKHNDSVTFPRPLHQSWNGLTLPPDHHFWKEHYPPNGWGCQCRVVPVTKSTFMKAVANGRGPADAPPPGNTEGIDEGFNYAPGANVDMSLAQVVQDKMITYPRAISRALSKSVNNRVLANESIPNAVEELKNNLEANETLFLGFAEDPDRLREVIKESDYYLTKNQTTEPNLNHLMLVVNSDTIRHVENSHGQDGNNVDDKTKRVQIPPAPEDYAKLPLIVNEADAIVRSAQEIRKERSTVTPVVKFQKEIDGVMYTAVMEVLHGKKNRSLSLITMFIRTVW